MNVPKLYLGLLVAVAALSFLLGALVLSNYKIERKSLASNEDPDFKAVSDILLRKCADCHSLDMTVKPAYGDWPIARQIIERNMKEGRASFLLSKDKLSGKIPFSAGDIDRLSQALGKGNMPPVQYITMHWDSALNKREYKILIDFIRRRGIEFDIRPIPKDNFFRPDLNKAELGKRLFFDRGLSGDGSVSCADCHSPSKGGVPEHYALRSAPNVPSVLNSAYNFAQYWDGRAKDLKAQVLDALVNPVELNSSHSHVLSHLNSDPACRADFETCFSDGINLNNLATAIAEYERTLLTPGSRFDRFLEGDKSALRSEERDGFELFKRHGCSSCHGGPALGGLSFEKLGAEREYFSEGTHKEIDNGRFNITKNEKDRYYFKVPILRNVALRKQFMHDGSVKTLADAVRLMSKYQCKRALNESEIKKICAFLESLTAEPELSKR